MSDDISAVTVEWVGAIQPPDNVRASILESYAERFGERKVHVRMRWLGYDTVNLVACYEDGRLEPNPERKARDFPFILWGDYEDAGWWPRGFDTEAEAREYMKANTDGKEMRLTARLESK